MRTFLCLLAIMLSAPGLAGDPDVVERTLPDGLTELGVVADGKTLATYRVNLRTHQEPATHRDDRIERWERYRFGGFFCFNDNQFDGRELSQNRDVKLYHPSKLDVAGWAAAMRGAGMKYAVLTTRHTSGFLLWDSATTQFDVAASPNPTDVAGAFVAECRKAGIAPAFYYCLWGGKAWMPHPNARAIILAQLHELATRYGDIACFWIDMANWLPADLSPQEIYQALRNCQPDAVVIFNQHIQDGTKIHYFPTDALNGEVVPPPAGGHRPFRRVNGKRYYLPFEFEPVSQRIPKGTPTPAGQVGAWFTYGEGKGFPASQPFPAQFLFDWIRQAYDRGAANVLLSLAADYPGSMRAEDIEQLTELGRMLREAGLLELPDGAPEPALSLAADKPVRASGVWQDNVQTYGPAAAFDDDPSTRWAGPEGARAGWLEVDLGAPRQVARVVIQEGWDRTRKFSVQYRVGGQWRVAAADASIGSNRELNFPPVEAQLFRLEISEAVDVPTIWEFELFAPAQDAKITSP